MAFEELEAAVIAEANSFVESTRKAFSIELDYSEKSIAYLDDIFEDIRSDLSEEGVGRVAQIGGCYIGETARRLGLGNWIDGTGEGIPEVMRQPILFQANNEKNTITDPISWVGKRLNKRPRG